MDFLTICLKCMHGFNEMYETEGRFGMTRYLQIVSILAEEEPILKFISAEHTASIAQLVERPLSEREVVGSNPAAAPYQRCKKKRLC